MLPRSFGRHIGVLLGHPVGIGGGRNLTRREARDIARLSDRPRRLQPNDDVELGPHRRPASPDALDDHEVTITVERDRTVSTPTDPGRRPVVQRMPITQHRQYVVDQ